MKKIFCLFALSFGYLHAQVQLGGAPYSPAAAPAATIAMTNASCTVASQTGCTVTGPGGASVAIWYPNQILNGTLSAGQTLTYPLGNHFWFSNNTGQIVTMGGATGRTVAIPVAAKNFEVNSPDNANYDAVGSSGGGGLPTIAAHTYLGNSSGSSATAAPTAIGAYDSSVPAFATSSGGPTAYTATLTPAPSALTTGLTFTFIPATENSTAAPTMNLNSLGVKTITKCGAAPLASSGDFNPSGVATLFYDGTEFQLLTPQIACGASSYVLPAATTGALGGVECAAGVTSPCPALAKVASTGQYGDLLNPPSTAVLPSRGVVALYSFNEGAFTSGTIHDTSGANACSGAPCNFSITGASTDPVMTGQGLNLIQASLVGGGQQTYAVLPSLTGIRSIVFGEYIPPLANGVFVAPSNWGSTICQQYWTPVSWITPNVRPLWSAQDCDGSSLSVNSTYTAGGNTALTRAVTFSAQPQTWGITLGNGVSGDVDHVYANGVEQAYVQQYPALAGGTLTGVPVLGNLTNLYPSYATGFPGTLYCLAFYNVELNAQEMQQAATACNTNAQQRGISFNPSTQAPPTLGEFLLVAGDSISSNTGGAAPFATNPMSGLNDSAIVSYPNGLPSWTCEHIMFQVPFREGALLNSFNRKSYAVEECGENNYAAGDSAAQIVQAKINLGLALQKAGAKKVFLTTMMSRAGYDTMKDAINPLVRAAAKQYGLGLVDVASYPNIGADGAYANTTYFVDGIHNTAPGKVYWTQGVVNAVNEYEGSTLHGCGVTASPITTTTYSEVAADGCVRANSASNNVAITLVQCNGYSQPRTIKNIDTSGITNTVTVSPFSGDLIDGASSAITVGNGSTLVLWPRVVDTTGVCHWERESND